MVSKRFSQKKLDELQRRRELRKSQISEALQQAMTGSDGTRREYFDAVDLCIKLKVVDVDNVHDWTYEGAKKLISELLSFGLIAELECGKKYVPSGGDEKVAPGDNNNGTTVSSRLTKG